jgi:hypothetical protein
MTADQSLDVKRCPDCQVAPGVVHEGGCDVARCRVTGNQMLICAVFAWPHYCMADIWTGVWPGVKECERWGWFTAEGQPDLNRLAVDAWWDPVDQCWARK